MTRVAFFALLAAGIASASASRADVPVAPMPREVRPDGTRDPAPEPEAAKKEDPREIVERIIKNSNAVGDKLAMTDTGTDTRKTQDRILKDIDALLNPDDPPPPKPDQSQDQQKDKDDKNKDKNKDKGQDGHPKDKKQDGKGGGMGKDMEPMAGGGMGSEPMPMGGEEPKERRPRKGESQAKQDAKDDPNMKQPGGGGGAQQKQDMKAGKPKDSKAGGTLPDPTGDAKRPPSSPLLPAEDDVVKDVWGHLPEKLRQQATEYYKQEIMPRYAELLKRYYSSMAEKK
jgi:hypothetical protein